MPKVIVLDTHIWFWLINQEYERFPERWRDEIKLSERVGVSPLSCYEIACRRGRLELPCLTDEWLYQALEPAGIELLPMTAEITSRAVNLSPVHKDPFDRMIIATALSYDAKLASVDRLFIQYSELNGILMSEKAET